MLIIYLTIGAIVVVVLFYIQSLRESLKSEQQRYLRATQMCETWQYRFDRHLNHSRKTIELMRTEFRKNLVNRRIQLYEVYHKSKPSEVSIIAVAYHEHPPVLTLDAYYPEFHYGRLHFGQDFSPPFNQPVEVIVLK